MIAERKDAFDKISKIFSIMRMDIEHHQKINDLSLNIHGENYFRDIFSFVYDCNFTNANHYSHNEPYIDLVDENKKIVVQITTTRTKEKIINSLKSLGVDKYIGYKVYIYYLIGKAMPSSEAVKAINQEYSVDLKSILKDSTSFIKDIESLETNRLILLYEKYFEGKESRYTHEIVLDLVFRKLLKEHSSVVITYDDDFGSIDTDKKILLNNINERVSCEIRKSLDYTAIIDGLDGDLGGDLRDLIVKKLYKEILVDQLKSKVDKNQLKENDVQQLQAIALNYNLDFSKLINILKNKIESLLIIKDFNSLSFVWVLVAYFFEICDVGIK